MTSGTDEYEFNAPRGISLGSDGNLYIADAHNDRIAIYSTGGTFIRHWGIPSGTNYEPANFSRDITEGEGVFTCPYDVFVSSSNRIYVANTLEGNLTYAMIDKTAPVVTIQTPENSVFAPGKITINVKAVDALTPVLKVEMAVNKKSNWSTCTLVASQSEGKSKTYACTTTNILVLGVYHVYVRSTDSKNNTNTSSEYDSVNILVSSPTTTIIQTDTGGQDTSQNKLTFIIKDSNGDPLANVMLIIDGSAYTTDAQGRVELAQDSSYNITYNGKSYLLTSSVVLGENVIQLTPEQEVDEPTNSKTPEQTPVPKTTYKFLWWLIPLAIAVIIGALALNKKSR